MGNVPGYVVASLSVGTVFVVYVHIYSSHKLLRTNVFTSERLPTLMYLYIRYLTKAVTRRTGRFYAPTKKREVVYTVLNCRLQAPLLRRFCSLAGYGWDYPDTDFRDVPLCFPECLCWRLLLMVLTDGGFGLSPAGLIRVHQTLKTLQPVDELKKGPFMLKARVLEYHQSNTGVEVVICLSAISRADCPVWESVLTLLSSNKTQAARRCIPGTQNESQPDQRVPVNVKQVELRVPRTTSLQCGWSLCVFYHLLSLPALLFGYRLQMPISPSQWMLSVCLAEIEKHKGVEVITAPVNVTANFKNPWLVPGRVTIKFWEMTKSQCQSSVQGLGFSVQQHGTNTSLLDGLISRS